MNGDHEAYKQFLHDAVGTLPVENPLGDLNHPVHPLFGPQNFFVDDGETSTDISISAYTAMLPALRLATCLITEPLMLKPFDHIANGFVTGDANGNMYIAQGTLEGTRPGYAYIQDVFRHMVSYVRFSFSLDNSHLGPNDMAISQIEDCSTPWTHPPCFDDHITYSSGYITNRALRNLRVEVSFRDFYHTYFCSDIDRDTQPNRLSALFSFTLLLMHELAHTFAFFVENAWFEGPRDPRWGFDEVWQEHGYAYEQWFFQGYIMVDVAGYAKLATDASIFPTDLLVLADTMLNIEEPDVCWEIVVEGRVMTYLRADVIRRWFLKATWDGIRGGVDVHSRILGKAKRSGLVMRADGTLFVTYDEDVGAAIQWRPGPTGVDRWFHSWTLVKAGCAHNDGEEIHCVEDRAERLDAAIEVVALGHQEVRVIEV